MTDEKLDQPRNITLLPDQMQSGAIVKLGTQSEIPVCQDILAKRFALAKTPQEYALVIEDMERIHELDKRKRQLNHAEKLAESQLHKDIFQRNQQVVASVISVGIGICFIQAFPLAGLLIIILGLAKPLGYSLGEISELFDGLTGFPKDSNKLLSNGNDRDIQSEEPKNAKF